MKRLLFILLISFFVLGSVNAQPVGNGEVLSLTGTNISSFFNSIECLATTIQSMERINSIPDIEIYTANSSINFTLQFFTSSQYDRYIFSYNGTNKTIYLRPTEQTYTINIDMGTDNSISTGIDVSYVLNGTAYLAGNIGINVIKGLDPPTNLTAYRSGNGKSVNLTWDLTGEVSSVQVQHRASGGNWSTKTINGNPTSTTISNLSLSSLEFRVRSGNSTGYSQYSSTQTVDALNLYSATDLEVINPYHYNLSWTDPNSDILTGTIEVQVNYYANYWNYVATINDFHATIYYLGSNVPTGRYRLKFTDSFGRVSYSNIADEAILKPVTDLEVINPYHYNLSWTDPNADFLTGTIEVQVNYYQNYWNYVATINDLHAIAYYLGSIVPRANYRLKLTASSGRIAYSNVASFSSSGGRISNQSSVVNIEEDEASNELIDGEMVIYPVPASNKIYLKTELFDSNTYLIYDINGKILDQGTFLLSQSENGIDISSLKSGMHFINLNGRNLGKFIVE